VRNFPSNRRKSCSGYAGFRGERSGHDVMPTYEASSVSIPGAIDAMLTMANDYGSKDRAEIFAPSIHYAQEGIPVAPRVAFDWKDMPSEMSGAAAKFFLHNGKAPKAGEIFTALMISPRQSVTMLSPSVEHTEI